MPDLHLQPQTTFRDIQQSFGQLDGRLGGKHLRMDEGRGLHLHDSGKWSGIGAKAAERRAAKHEAAFESVMAAIDQQLGRPGLGEQILRDVLTPEQFDQRLIAVDDLARIGEQVDLQAQRNATIETILTNLAPKIDDEATLDDLRSLLRLDDSVDVAMLEVQSRELPNASLLTLDVGELRQDLRREDMGVCQALARHGIIETHHTRQRGSDVHWAPGSDPEGLTYGNVAAQDKIVRGTRYETESFNGFVVCRVHGLHDQEDSGELRKTGDKIHLSVEPDQVEQAWDIAMPILLKYPDVVKEFKVTDMKFMLGKVDEYNRKLENPRSEHQRQLDTETRDDAVRVTQGTQITLYFHEAGGGAGVPLDRARQMMDEITQALHEGGVHPGERPESDHGVTEFASYRFEKREDGSPLYTDAPDYDQLKPGMREKPLFQALTA